MRRRPRALTRSLPWYALAALITVTLYWNFDAHVEAHGEPGVDLMARQEIARITERVRMLEDLGVSGLRSLRTKTERDPEKEQAPRGDEASHGVRRPSGSRDGNGAGMTWPCRWSVDTATGWAREEREDHARADVMQRAET